MPDPGLAGSSVRTLRRNGQAAPLGLAFPNQEDETDLAVLRCRRYQELGRLFVAADKFSDAQAQVYNQRHGAGYRAGGARVPAD